MSSVVSASVSGDGASTGSVFANSIVSDVPPFYGHGLVIIGLGVAGVICLLAGVLLIGMADK